MKKFALAALGTIAAGAAAAGTFVYTAPDATMIDDGGAAMGGSGGWLIPLIIIAVLALALTSSDSSN